MNNNNNKKKPQLNDSQEVIVRLNFHLRGAEATAFLQFMQGIHIEHNSVTAKKIILDRLQAEQLYVPAVILPGQAAPTAKSSI